MSSSTEKSYHHGRLLEDLRATGFDMLTEHPASRISMRELARRAGVSHQAPYHHFSDKKALLEDLSTECMRRFGVEQEAAVHAAHGGIAALRAQGLAYIRFAARYPHAFALIYDPAVCDPGNPGPEKQVQIALTYIYGIGPKFAGDILAAAKVEPTTRVKDLTEAEEQKIRDIIDNNYT